MQLILVLARSLLVAVLVSGLMNLADWSGSSTGMLLGAALCVLPAVLLLGAVVHEGTSIRAAAVHLLDWFLKLLVIGAVVGAFK